MFLIIQRNVGRVLFSLETALGRIGVDKLQTYYATGRILETLGCLDSAIFCYGRKLEASPIDKKILERLGRTMERKKTFPSAVKEKWGFIYDPDDICLCRWTLLHEATQWFEQVKKAIPEGSQPSGSQRHIAMLAVYPWWISIFLAIAAVLVRMGHKVDVFWLPYNSPENKDPKWVTGLIEREMRALESANLHQNISLVRLHDIEPAKLPPHMSEIVEPMNLMDVRIRKGSPTVDLSSEADAKIYRCRLTRNTDAAQRLWSVMEDKHYDNWVLHNGSWGEFGIAHSLARAKQQNTVNMEFSFKKENAYLVANSTFAEFLVEDAWARCAPHVLSDSATKQQERLTQLSEDPSLDGSGWQQKFQTSEVKEKKALRGQLGLDPSRPAALLLPGLTIDSRALSPTVNTIFKDTHDWVHKTVAYFIDHPHPQLIIRAHPFEKIMKTNDPLQRIILDKFSSLPDNIFFLDACSNINTYGLIEISDLGIVYISDCGFEMVLRGKPAITCGRAKFLGKGITLDPENLEEYYGILDRFSEDRNAFPVSKEQKERAAFFNYFNLNHLYKPFPWRPAGIWGNMKDFPMETVLSDEGGAPFRESFSIISGADPSLYGVVGKTRTFS